MKKKNLPLLMIGKLITVCLFAVVVLNSCGVYSFKDVTIPPEIKTIKISYIENKAGYVNPQLSARVTDQLQQKILNQTRLTRTNADDAHYKVSGYISSYNVSTVSVTNQQASTNRLTVGAHIVLTNTLTNKTEEYDVSRNFDFPASMTLQQAEASLTTDIVRNLVDEIFNRLFSNW